jgi:predicted small lipoprotein YifL
VSPAPRPSAPRRRAPAWSVALLALAALATLAGCARKGPPSGGPPDLEPPRVSAASPDSGAAGVALDGRISITFSEGMEPRSTGEAVALAPRIEIRQRRWSSSTLTLVLDTLMAPGRTYTLFVDNTARDRHGNTMRVGKAIVFSTGDSFPAGSIAGRIEARGFPAEGTYLWGYAGGRVPDSTARDFDALGIADEQGHFGIPGLPVPGRYRLWAFADLNGNRSFEPEKDVLVAADTTFDLSPRVPAATGFALRVVNPRAPGKVRGAVVDSTGDSLGVVRVIAVSEDDSTRRVVAEVDENLQYELTLDAGSWLVRAFRDHDRNRAWRVDTEPASALERIRIGPADEVTGLTLKLRMTLSGSGP